MICPNCKLKMKNDFCIKCGYMNNGNYISTTREEDKNTDIRIYNDDFDEMNSNQRKYLNLLLGSFYFSYRNHLVLGVIIGIIEFFITIFVGNIISALNYIGYVHSIIAYFAFIFYIIANRSFYMGFSNVICLIFDRLRIKKIKKNPNYMEIFVKHKSKSIVCLFLNILIYVAIIFLFIV